MIFPFLLMIVVHSESRNRNYRAHKLNNYVWYDDFIQGDAEHKRSYFYENLPVPTKMAFFFKETYISGYFVE